MSNNRVNNVVSKVISNIWATLEHINFDFTFKSGKSINLTHEVYGKTDGVAILLYNSQTKKVLLSKQFRMPVYTTGVSNGFLIEVVGGTIDKKESAEACVFREVLEEVGYSLCEIKKVCTIFLSPGMVKERVHLFVGIYKDENKIAEGGGMASEDEEIEVLEFFFKDALNMIETGDIIDARTILLLQYAQINDLFNKF
jgi:nudix-type nucleoside diphosphatase (YffH/AdpP family)